MLDLLRGSPIKAVAREHERVAYVAALIVLVLAAVIGLIGIQHDSTSKASADGKTPPPQSAGAPTTATRIPTPPAHQATATDRRGDTTGPDLLSVAVIADHGTLSIRLTLAAPVTDDVVLRVFIDADSDRTTGSLSFPCSAATLGADYELATRGPNTAQLLTSTADGCSTPFRARKSSDVTIHTSGARVDLGIPTRTVRRPGEHVIGLFAQAVRTSGGQIDSCPGQHDRRLSVRY